MGRLAFPRTGVIHSMRRCSIPAGFSVQSGQGNWITAPSPSAFYATEIAARRGFIESVVMRLTSVVSRQTHGRAGTFDINLPQTPRPGIECRSGDYAIVFTFAGNVSIQGVRVTSGAGRVKNYTVTGNQVLVNLTQVVTRRTSS